MSGLGFVGVDPSALVLLASELDDTALQLRACVAWIADAAGVDVAGDRLHLLSVAEWAEREASDLRRRAVQARQTGLTWRWWAGPQRGWNNKKISADEIERLKQISADTT